MRTNPDFEILALRLLSAYYRNDHSMFTRFAADHMFFSTPDCPADVRPISFTRSDFFPKDPHVSFAVRKILHHIPFVRSSIRLTKIEFLLDIYLDEIPVGQKKQNLFTCWQNATPGIEPGSWRLTVFQLQDSSDTPLPAMVNLLSGSTAPYFRVPSVDTFVSEAQTNYLSYPRKVVPIEDRNKTTHFLDINEIIWAETDKRHSILHIHKGTIYAKQPLSSLADILQPPFYKPHNSYLFNPRYLYRIRNRTLILTDGTIIPVPQKKVNQVLADLNHILLAPEGLQAMQTPASEDC